MHACVCLCVWHCMHALCASVHVCMHTCMRVCLPLCAHVCGHAHLYECICTSTRHLCAFSSSVSCTDSSAVTCVYICAHVRVGVRTNPSPVGTNPSPVRAQVRVQLLSQLRFPLRGPLLRRGHCAGAELHHLLQHPHLQPNGGSLQCALNRAACSVPQMAAACSAPQTGQLAACPKQGSLQRATMSLQVGGCHTPTGSVVRGHRGRLRSHAHGVQEVVKRRAWVWEHTHRRTGPFTATAFVQSTQENRTIHGHGFCEEHTGEQNHSQPRLLCRVHRRTGLFTVTAFVQSTQENRAIHAHGLCAEHTGEQDHSQPRLLCRAHSRTEPFTATAFAQSTQENRTIHGHGFCAEHTGEQD